MAALVLFVSVNKSFNPSYSLRELEPWVERAWCLTVAKAAACDRVVAVIAGTPVGAWRVRGAFPTDETYEVGGTIRPRVGLSLGDPLPILPAYWSIPALRHGVARVECNVDPLPIERTAELGRGLSSFDEAWRITRAGAGPSLDDVDKAARDGRKTGSPIETEAPRLVHRLSDFEPPPPS